MRKKLWFVTDTGVLWGGSQYLTDEEWAGENIVEWLHHLIAKNPDRIFFYTVETTDLDGTPLGSKREIVEEHEYTSVWKGCNCGHPGAGCYCQPTSVPTGRKRTITYYSPVVGEWR